MSLGPLMVDIEGLELTAVDREVLRHPLVGSVILFARNYADPGQLQALTAAIHELRDPPLIISVDHEGGRVQRFRAGFTPLPPARFIGHQYDMDRGRGVQMAHDCGWLLAAELRAIGVDLSFAPVVDLDYEMNEAIGDRAFHRDPEVVANLANACMAGMREAGMAAVAKHFPGHGAVVADSHVALPVDRRELTDLEPELLPYRRLIANNLVGVMVAHIVYPQVDHRPASLSPRWIGDILRGELDFHGVVFADDLNMAGAASVGGMTERARLALAAGCDVLPVCNNRPAVIELLENLGDVINPASQARWVRLHGRAAPGYAGLQATAHWRELNARIRGALNPPALDLSGQDA
jgi:beta-N-acetylhexosaminidase